jgi:hypothetical protein
MKTTLRTLAAIFAGLLVLFVLLAAVELFGNAVHPLPEGFKGTKEEICLHVARYPHWVLAVVVPAWAIAAFAGAWTAVKIGNLYSSTIFGLLTLAALVLNISMLPYPIWFKIANLILIPTAILAASRLSPSSPISGSSAPPP